MSWLTQILGLDSWKEVALEEIGEAKEQALQAVVKEWIDKRIHELRPNTMYIIQVAEHTGKQEADALRRAVESCGAFCVVVAADSMRVVSFSTKIT